MKKVYKILIMAGCAAVAAVIIFVNVSSGDPSNPVTALQVTQEAQPSDSQPEITAPESIQTPPAVSVAPSSNETAGDAPTPSVQESPKSSLPASKESESNSSASSGVDTSAGSTPAPNPTTAPTPQPTATPTPAPTGAPTPCPSGDEQQTIDDTRDWIEDNQPTPALPDPDLPGIGNW
jgi:hypothetical protein